MKKNLQIIISIDDVELSKIEVILDAMEKIIAEYEDKRIQTSITDFPTVKLR